MPLWSVASLDPRLFDRAVEVMVAADMNLLPLRQAVGDRSEELGLRTWFNQCFLRYGLRFGEVQSTPEVEGLTIWLPPGQSAMSLLRLLRVGFHRLPLRLGVRATLRALEVARLTGDRHVASVQPDHWYLYNIAVDPRHQHRGIGSALLRPVLEQADRADQECYLEARDASGVGYYQRHGFKPVSASPLRLDTFEIWPMRRPRSSEHQR